MELTTAILRDLASGQSTTDAIADRQNLHTDHAQTILDRFEKDGLVTSFLLGGLKHIKVYKLTGKPISETTDDK